jgi:hypothetical protein
VIRRCTQVYETRRPTKKEGARSGRHAHVAPGGD